MKQLKNQQIVLKNYLTGFPKSSDFESLKNDAPSFSDGEVLIRTIYISLDPYMRGLMSGQRSYRDPAQLGVPVSAGTIGEVIDSRDKNFNAGDLVLGSGGWQSLWAEAGRKLRKLNPETGPITHSLGVLGMPGHTAYAGITGLAELKAGETLFVSAATGAVGSIVGQIAKIKGARVIGVAGTDEKCNYAIKELGFDNCFNRKENLRENLKQYCPNGIDVNFENVGGEIFWNVLHKMNIHGRVIVCGFISQYNDSGTLTTVDQSMKLMRALVVKRVQLKGLLVYDWKHVFNDFQRDVSSWIAEEKIKYKIDVVEGIDNLVNAFKGLLEGKNFGKLLVRISKDPTV